MKTVFADTSFFVAFLNSADADHEVATQFMASLAARIVTTDWVLAELGNFLAKRPNRNLFAAFVHDLASDPRMDVEPASRESFESGCVLYESRPDKDWSLTDCISMTVMRDRAIHEVLTADHHFRQAGFVILMP